MIILLTIIHFKIVNVFGNIFQNNILISYFEAKNVSEKLNINNWISNE